MECCTTPILSLGMLLLQYFFLNRKAEIRSTSVSVLVTRGCSQGFISGRFIWDLLRWLQPICRTVPGTAVSYLPLVDLAAQLGCRWFTRSADPKVYPRRWVCRKKSKFPIFGPRRILAEMNSDWARVVHFCMAELSAIPQHAHVYSK